MKLLKKICIAAIIIIYHRGILEAGDLVLMELQDKEVVAQHLYKTHFEEQYKERIGKDILCDYDAIFTNEDYVYTSPDYVEYYCENGKAVVYLFEKGFGRYVMLASWTES